MIKAVFLVLAVSIVVAAIVVLVRFTNKDNALRGKKSKKKKLEFDNTTGVYYDPKTMNREAKDGVISYTSKDK